jgi:hypothetical protein
MSQPDNPYENLAQIILAGSAVISIIIGFASSSIATAIGSFIGMVFIFGVIGELIRKK